MPEDTSEPIKNCGDSNCEPLCQFETKKNFESDTSLLRGDSAEFCQEVKDLEIGHSQLKEFFKQSIVIDSGFELRGKEFFALLSEETYRIAAKIMDVNSNQGIIALCLKRGYQMLALEHQSTCSSTTGIHHTVEF